MISLLVWIVVIGLIDYLIFKYTPIPAPFKTIVLVVSVIFCIVLSLNAFGINPFALPSPRVR